MTIYRPIALNTSIGYGSLMWGVQFCDTRKTNNTKRVLVARQTISVIMATNARTTIHVVGNCIEIIITNNKLHFTQQTRGVD